MNIRQAIHDTMQPFIEGRWKTHDINGIDEHLAHLSEMWEKIDLDRTMSDDKLNRWIGWIQAVIVICTNATLDEMKEINRRNAD